MTMSVSNRRALVRTFLALTLSTASALILSHESFLIERRVTPAGFEGEAQFLELLKYPKPPVREFHVEDAPRWDVQTVARYLSDGTITFTDVNDSSRITEAKSATERSLQSRKGRAFRVFSHLSHIYSIPYRQYSELHFSSPKTDTSIVEVSTWYRLTFQRTPQGVKLKQIDYLVLEVE